MKASTLSRPSLVLGLSTVLFGAAATNCGDSSTSLNRPGIAPRDAVTGSDAHTVSETAPNRGRGGGHADTLVDSPFACDIAAEAGTPCVVAYSMARPLFASYTGYLFRLQRESDNTTIDIGIVDGQADVGTASSFCSATTCYFVTAYDQTGYRLDAINSVRAGSVLEGRLRPPVYLTMQVAGKTIPYWGNGFLQAGSRADSSLGNGAMPVGSVPVTEYAISGPAIPPGDCCYDFGEAEEDIVDTGGGHMFALNLGPSIVGMDLEDGGIYGRVGGISAPYVVLGKTDGVSLFTLKASAVGGSLQAAVGDAPYCSGTLTFYNQQLSCFGYGPMYLEGGLTIGVGGDGSGEGYASGAFIEGGVIAAQTSDATDDAIQTDINGFFGR